MTKFKKSLKLSILFLTTLNILFLGSCKDDETDQPVENKTVRSVILTNEGGFQQGNASISMYYPSTEEVVHDVFENANSRPLGDVLMPASFVDGQMWLVVNNSGNAWIVDSTDMSIKDEVIDLGSPRFAVRATDGEVYISNLFGNKLDVVSTSDYAVSGQIALNGWSERMLPVGDMMWVANKSSEYLYQIDVSSKSLVDSIKVRKNGGTLISYGSGTEAFLLCETEWDFSTKPCIYRIDLNTKEILDSLEFEVGDNVTHLTLDAANDELLYANSGLYRIAAGSFALSSTPINVLTDVVVYGIGIDPVNGDVYVSDAGDFTSRSTIHRLSSNGTEISTFEAGVNCNGFVFK